MFEASRSYFIKTDRVLVPMFRGVNSIKALKIAFDLAKTYNSELTAITIRERNDSIEWSNSVTLVTNAYKDGKRTGLKVIPKISTYENVKIGLIKETSSHYYDLLLMATHKRALLSGSVFGSIGDYVLKNLSIPLILLSISDSEYPYKKILLPISEEINIRAAVFFAMEMAKMNNAKLMIMDLRKYDKNKTHGFKMLFNNIGEILKNGVDISLLKSGYNTNIKEEINSIIEKEDPDCVIIGTGNRPDRKYRINSDIKYIVKDPRVDTILIKK